MIVVRTNQTHVLEAQAWFAMRGQLRPASTFSSTGFAVEGVAAVWLYLTNSSVAVLEYLVANPEIPKQRRNDALDAVVRAASEHARAMGADYLTTIVDRDVVEARALRHGFEVAARNQTTMVMDLTKGGT